MIEVYGFAFRKHKKLAGECAQMALDFVSQPNLDLTIKFVGAREIKKLNCTFRNIDKVTDVLSFPATNAKVGDIIADGEYLGDMALCLSQARKQAKQFGNSLDKEIQKLVVHSVLHLFGYDHIKDQDYAVMNKKEQEIEKYIDDWRKKDVV